MRAVVCREFCQPEALAVADVPVPRGEGVPIRVRAAAVNFADSLIIAGKYQDRPEPPFTPGFEVAGEVTADGAGFRAGQRVMAILDHGGYAEQALARPEDVFPIPDALDFETAASMPIAYLTSAFGLEDRARLRPGEVLLVHGAAGGVGLTAVECGKAMGATVIATAGGPEKLEIARAHGADHLIDYRTQDIRDTVKELTGGRGADVVYDPVGGDIFTASLRCTVPDGRILLVGFASGDVPRIKANHLLVKNVTVIGYAYGAYRRLRPADLRASAEKVLAMWEKGEVKPHVSHRFPLEDTSKAIRTLLDRKSTGKVVVTVG